MAPKRAPSGTRSRPKTPAFTNPARVEKAYKKKSTNAQPRRPKSPTTMTAVASAASSPHCSLCVSSPDPPTESCAVTATEPAISKPATFHRPTTDPASTKLAVKSWQDEWAEDFDPPPEHCDKSVRPDYQFERKLLAWVRELQQQLAAVTAERDAALARLGRVAASS